MEERATVAPMLAPHRLIALQVLSSRKDEEDPMMAGAAAVGFVISVFALILGVRYFKEKQRLLAALLFLVSGGSMLACVGISALLALAQVAWH